MMHLFGSCSQKIIKNGKNKIMKYLKLLQALLKFINLVINKNSYHWNRLEKKTKDNKYLSSLMRDF